MAGRWMQAGARKDEVTREEEYETRAEDEQRRLTFR